MTYTVPPSNPFSRSACGGSCRWPHAFREDGVTRICEGPKRLPLWRRILRRTR